MIARRKFIILGVSALAPVYALAQPAKLHLVINGKTAKSLGIKLSQELLLRAEEVIE